MITIPAEYQPHPEQIPSDVTTDEQMDRWKLCFAIGRAVTQRDFDPVFVRQLYEGDLPTGDLEEYATQQ